MNFQHCGPVDDTGSHSRHSGGQLRVAKILIQLGLDPNNGHVRRIIHRLLEIFLANITLANMFALVAQSSLSPLC